MALDLKRELAAVDLRNKDFYDKLTDEEKKSFNPYILMRFVSNVDGDADLQEWFVLMTNELVNKNHWTLSKNHKGLLWKLYAGVGAGVKAFHPYLAASKAEKVNKLESLIAELNPTMKMSDVKLLTSLMDKNDIEDLFDKLGYDKKQRKAYG